MNWIRMKHASAAVAACMLLLPVAALAQTGAIAGSVSDETGGVLPGVTVEAASPALIEGVRATVTDGAGLYTIEALRPGSYTVTFTLPGFNTFVRDGIELVSDFTANVDGHDDGRLHRGDGHGLGRQPGDRRAERREPAEPVARADRHAAYVEDVLRPGGAHARHDPAHLGRRPRRRRDRATSGATSSSTAAARPTAS